MDAYNGIPVSRAGILPPYAPPCIVLDATKILFPQSSTAATTNASDNVVTHPTNSGKRKRGPKATPKSKQTKTNIETSEAQVIQVSHTTNDTSTTNTNDSVSGSGSNNDNVNINNIDGSNNTTSQDNGTGPQNNNNVNGTSSVPPRLVVDYQRYRLVQVANQMLLSIFPLLCNTQSHVLCIQIETANSDKSKITEIGFVYAPLMYQPQLVRYQACHFLIKENIYLENGKQPTSSSKFKFASTSEILPSAIALNRLASYLPYTSLIVTQNFRLLLQILSANSQQELISSLLYPRLRKVDLGLLFKVRRPELQTDVDLPTILNYFFIPYDPSLLYNAGNDALYILFAFYKLLYVQNVDNLVQ